MPRRISSPQTSHLSCKFVPVARSQNRHQRPDLGVRQVPPLQPVEKRNDSFFKSLAQYPSGASNDDRPRRHIARNHRSCANYRAISNRYARHDARILTDPDIVADRGVRLWMKHGRVMLHQAMVEHRERVGRKPVHRMIACGQKTHAMRDLAKLANHQPLWRPRIRDRGRSALRSLQPAQSRCN